MPPDMVKPGTLHSQARMMGAEWTKLHEDNKERKTYHGVRHSVQRRD